MKSEVIGISGSPQKEGKVETLIQEVLSASHLSSELIRLHEITVKPCLACNGCRTDNVCVIDDDWNELQSKIIDAAAVVIGGWAFSGMIDSATKALMERFWSFRHHHMLTRTPEHNHEGGCDADVTHINDSNHSCHGNKKSKP